MKQFKPIIDRFKDTFFDGQEYDPECGVKKKPAAKPRAAPKKKLEQEILILDSQEEEKDEVSKDLPKGRKRKADDSQKSSQLSKRVKTAEDRSTPVQKVTP